MVIIKIIIRNDVKLDGPVINTDSFLSIYKTYNDTRLVKTYFIMIVLGEPLNLMEL